MSAFSLMSEQMIGRLVPPIRDAFPHVVKQHSTRRTKKVAKKATTRRIFKKATPRPPNRRRCAMKTQSSISCLSLLASSNYTKTSSIWIVGSGLPSCKSCYAKISIAQFFFLIAHQTDPFPLYCFNYYRTYRVPVFCLKFV